jgi:hypothetical protein
MQIHIYNYAHIMHSNTIFISLLAFAANVFAAPTPLRSVIRTVPNVHEVIRNPVPIDAGIRLDIEALAQHLSLFLHSRAVPAVAKEASPVVPVINRSVSVVEAEI